MVSERLIDLRKMNNLTQEQVSEIANVSRQAYSSYENGTKPSLDSLLKLSDYYKVSLDYLVGISDIRDVLYDDPKIVDYINECLKIYYKFLNKKE